MSGGWQVILTSFHFKLCNKNLSIGIFSLGSYGKKYLIKYIKIFDSSDK